MVGIFSPKISEICARCSSTRKKHFAAIASKIGRHGRDIRPKIEIGPSGPPIFSNFPDFLNFIADNCRKFPPDVPRHCRNREQNRPSRTQNRFENHQKSTDFGRILDGSWTGPPARTIFNTYVRLFIDTYIYI